MSCINSSAYMGRFELALLLVTVSVLGSTGCGDGRPHRVPVSGKVLIDGQPLTYGYVRLVPNDARPAGGHINPDGTFTLTCYDGNDGCVPGTHKVSVVAVEALSGSSQKWHAPKQYVDPAGSPLRATVTQATDDLVIELSWQGGQPFIERFGPETASAE